MQVKGCVGVRSKWKIIMEWIPIHWTNQARHIKMNNVRKFLKEWNANEQIQMSGPNIDICIVDESNDYLGSKNSVTLMLNRKKNVVS